MIYRTKVSDGFGDPARYQMIFNSATGKFRCLLYTREGYKLKSLEWANSEEDAFNCANEWCEKKLGARLSSVIYP